MIAPNTVIGNRYRVSRMLGGGGMKMVYLAEDLRLANRRCALAEMVDAISSPDMQLQAVPGFNAKPICSPSSITTTSRASSTASASKTAITW